MAERTKRRRTFLNQTSNNDFSGVGEAVNSGAMGSTGGGKPVRDAVNSAYSDRLGFSGEDYPDDLPDDPRGDFSQLKRGGRIYRIRRIPDDNRERYEAQVWDADSEEWREYNAGVADLRSLYRDTLGQSDQPPSRRSFMSQEGQKNDDMVAAMGQSGDSVRELQSALVDAGYELPRFGVDGDYGNETKAAVAQAMQDAGMRGDGASARGALMDWLRGARNQRPDTAGSELLKRANNNAAR